MIRLIGGADRSPNNKADVQERSQRGKNNDRKQRKTLDGRSDRQSLKRGKKSERIHDTSSDGGYSESDTDGVSDTGQVRRHSHAKKNSKWQRESSEYLADHRNIENRVYEDRENLHGQTKKRTRYRSKGDTQMTMKIVVSVLMKNIEINWLGTETVKHTEAL